MYISMYISIYIYVYLYIYRYISISIYRYISISIYVYVYLYIYIYLYIYNNIIIKHNYIYMIILSDIIWFVAQSHPTTGQISRTPAVDLENDAVPHQDLGPIHAN